MIANHRLIDVPFVEAGTMRVPITPTLLVIHYTATPARTAAGVVRAFAMKGSPVSAHLVIDEEGRVTQCVEFNRRAAHAGRSKWAGRESCNNFSIGIELINPGPLELEPSSETFVDTLAGSRRPWPYGVFSGRHKHGGPYKHWAVYPSPQLAALEVSAKAICETYGIKEIVGHDDIAPDRKIDPGPAFELPMQNLRNFALGKAA